MSINSDAAMAIAFFSAAAAVAWAGAFAWVRWLAHRYDAPPATGSTLPATAMARLERMETGLEVLTLEVERLAEGQRYTVRLLDERLPLVLPPGARQPDPGRVVTPH